MKTLFTIITVGALALTTTAEARPLTPKEQRCIDRYAGVTVTLTGGEVYTITPRVAVAGCINATVNTIVADVRKGGRSWNR